MKLFDFIKDEAEKANKVLRNKITALLGVLESWKGDDCDDDILCLLSDSWHNDFNDFISNMYEVGPNKKRLAPSTIKNHQNTAKSLCRIGIESGYLPNIKMLSDGDDSIVAEFRGRHDAAEMAAALDAMMSFSPTVSLHRKMLDYSLLSIILCGIGLEGLLRTKASAYDGNSLVLEHMGNARLQLPAIARVLIERNLAKNGSDYLLPVISSVDTKEESDKKIAGIRSQAIWLSANLSISNKWIDNPMVAWLNLASRHTSLDKLKRFIDAVSAKGKLLASDFDDMLSDVAANVAKDRGINLPCWYAMVSLKRSAGKLEEMLYDDDGKALYGLVDSYPPQDPQFSKKDGKIISYNNPAVDRLLFIRATLPVVNLIQQMLKTEGIFYVDEPKKTDKARKLAQIPDAQVENLRRFLEKTDEKRLYRQEVNAVGKKVRVVAGMYKGCEGVIVEFEGDNPKGLVDTTVGIDSKKEKITYFAVKLVGNSFIMTPSVEATMVEEII